jgi:bifunctional pyridoxal-dependent enzyme with beta-cystathionase and maltose regulon repressor activities
MEDIEIRLKGEFTEEDLKKFAEVLREIEEKNKDKTYLLWIDRKYYTMRETMDMITRIFPRRKI